MRSQFCSVGKLVIVPKPTQGLDIYVRLTGACCQSRPRQSVVSACNTDECDTASALSYDKLSQARAPFLHSRQELPFLESFPVEPGLPRQNLCDDYTRFLQAGCPSCWPTNNIIITRMWDNAQPDGRPAEHRWRPLFNAAKFGWRPLLDAVQ